MEIREKIKIGIGVPLIIFLTFAVISYIQIRWIGRSFRQITGVEVPKNEAVSKMEAGLIGIGFELMGYIQDHNPERLESIRSCKEDFRRHQGIYCRLVGTKKAELLAVAADRNYAELEKIVEELINLEDHQVKKLAVLDNNIHRMSRVLGEGFTADIKADDRNAYAKLKAVVQMRDGIGEIKNSLNHYLMNNRQHYEDSIYEHQQDAERFVGVYKKLGLVPEQTQWLEQLSDIHAENMSLIKDVIALDKKQKSGFEEYRKARDGLRSMLGGDIENTNANLWEAERSSSKAISIYVVAVPIIVFFGLIITLISQAYITYLVTLPITELRDATVKISQGKYDTEVHAEPDDELGQLADSICAIAKELEKSRMLLLEEHNEEMARLERVETSAQS